MKSNVRNKVVIENQQVVKTYISGNIQREIEIYQCLKASNIHCAPIISINDQSLVLGLVSGESMYDIFQKCELNQLDFLPYLNQWVDYMQKFHGACHPYRYGDVNMTNFIYHNQKWVGIDFEQATLGTLLEDLADMMGYILYYHPVLTPYKKDCVKQWWCHSLRFIFNGQENRYLNQAMQRLNERRKEAYSCEWSTFLQCEE